MLHLAHLQLLDSALPVGGFSHSFGLETLIQRGEVSNAAELKEWCEAMLWGAWSASDALLIKAVYQWTPGQLDELWELDRAMHGSRLAMEAREGGRKMGKRLLQLGAAMHPHLEWAPLRAAIEGGRAVGTYPLVYGWLCFQLGVELDAAAQGFLYGNLSANLNNAVRAMRLGQTAAQTLLAALLPQIPLAWEAVRDRAPWEFSSGTPQADIAMMEHETLYSRLFMS